MVKGGTRRTQLRTNERRAAEEPIPEGLADEEKSLEQAFGRIRDESRALKKRAPEAELKRRNPQGGALSSRSEGRWRRGEEEAKGARMDSEATEGGKSDRWGERRRDSRRRCATQRDVCINGIAAAAAAVAAQLPSKTRTEGKRAEPRKGYGGGREV